MAKWLFTHFRSFSPIPCCSTSSRRHWSMPYRISWLTLGLRKGLNCNRSDYCRLCFAASKIRLKLVIFRALLALLKCFLSRLMPRFDFWSIVCRKMRKTKRFTIFSSLYTRGIDKTNCSNIYWIRVQIGMPFVTTWNSRWEFVLRKVNLILRLMHDIHFYLCLGLDRACVHLYSVSELHEEAITLALKVESLSRMHDVIECILVRF